MKARARALWVWRNGPVAARDRASARGLSSRGEWGGALMHSLEVCSPWYDGVVAPSGPPQYLAHRGDGHLRFHKHHDRPDPSRARWVIFSHHWRRPRRPRGTAVLQQRYDHEDQADAIHDAAYGSRDARAEHRRGYALVDDVRPVAVLAARLWHARFADTTRAGFRGFVAAGKRWA